MAIKQEVNAPLIWTIGAVSGFLFLAVVIGLQAWYLWAENREIQAKYETARNVVLERSLAKQRGDLSRSGLVEGGRTVIPINDAMNRIIETKGQLPTTRPVQ